MMTGTPADIKCGMVQKMLRHRVIDGKNYTIDAVVNMALQDSDQGKGRCLLEDEMLPQNEAGFARYGGQREAIHIVDVEKAVGFLEKHEAEVPWGFR